MRRFPGTRRPHAVHDYVRDEATAWFIGFCEDEVDAEGRERFARWLKTSPEHVQAYLQVSAFWEAAGRLHGSRKLELEELVRRAAAETNIVAFEHSVADGRRTRPSTLRWNIRRRPAALAACLALLFSASIGGLWWQRYGAVTYATAVGEERTLILPDSSTVELDARSKIRVRFTKAVRTVELLEGQALFRVSHNPDRPFIVATADAWVRDVGTQFDVDRSGTATVVTVLEGRVAALAAAGRVAPTPNGMGEIFVSAGQQVVLEPHVLLRPVQVNAGIAIAWTQGKLVFDGTPLSEVVEDFNRYNPRPLTIDDPKLLSLHVSGTFETADSSQLIQFLSQRFGLTAHETADGVRLSQD